MTLETVLVVAVLVVMVVLFINNHSRKNAKTPTRHVHDAPSGGGSSGVGGGGNDQSTMTQIVKPDEQNQI